MKDDVGSRRAYQISLDSLALDDDLLAKDLAADVRLTRITRGILASGRVIGTAIVECHRCLNEYEQLFESDFDQEYRPLIDVRSGLLVDQPKPEEELGLIDEAHELDVAEPIRQVAIVELPIKLLCGPDCPGPDAEFLADEGDDVDRRLGVLGELLEAEDDVARD
ncbi:MAG TPA: DUF177 domain-containing protein [Thermomicrobiales bacterium]|nr:DUF177 domain-containing protein [Thermomicrobiales bacterium]